MPISPRGKPYYTEEQAAQAREASALAYARSRGYALVRDGSRRYHLREHDSMVFLENGRWYWNSRRLSGRALDFMIFYEGRTMLEAVLTLTNDPAITGSTPAVNYRPPSAPPPPVKFVLPERAETTRHLYAYLCGTRGLDREIVHTLIGQGRLYQSRRELPGGKVIYNAVFVGLDGEGVPRSAFQRGLARQSTYKHEAAGSDKRRPFLMPGRGDVLYLFEGAIDAMSHATLCKEGDRDWEEDTRMATGGSFPMEAVTSWLDAHPEISMVGVAFDNDEAGRRFTHTVMEQLTPRGLHCFDAAPPEGKDWNKYLQLIREG